VRTPFGRRRIARLMVVGLLAGLGAVATGSTGGSAAPTPGGTDKVDWSTAVVDSTMQRFTPQTLGSWGYQRGLYLFAQYLVYKRTGDPRYLEYIKTWVDRFVDADGHISQGFNNLDSMRSGVLLLKLYRETQDPRYKSAADQIRVRLNTYPRTADGGFWHATPSRDSQLWADGVFMVLPFLAEYGQLFGDSAYTDDEVTKQLLIYAHHLQVGNGLLLHAWDEKRVQPWADPVTGRAPEHWCRAIGWYGMTLIHILDIIPANHPRREQLLTILDNLVRGFARYQDPKTGRWFQVVTRGDNPANWTETSCSAMYTFTISAAVERGFVPKVFAFNSFRGYLGVLQKISKDEQGLTNLTDISIGTNVGDLAYYLARERSTNDLHGLGAFIIMNEQLRTRGF
jgi:unsaturated rhamnogalacturonyl hydrolase